MSLLNDGKLAKTIASALAGVVYPITIHRTTGGSYDTGTNIFTPGATVPYVARGMVDSFSPTEIHAGLVQPTDRKVTLLAQGLTIIPTPATDKVVIDGAELSILSVSSDPARATWQLQVR